MGTMEVIFGPPGTGKTTELSRIATRRAEEDGSDSLLLCAYTRAAARELAGRHLPLDKNQIGTLHSHCYHALDHPTIAEGEYSTWNSEYPTFELSAQLGRDQDDPAADPSPHRGPKLYGDQLLELVDHLRHRLIPTAEWPPQAQQFFALWTAWKQAHGFLDFTDLLDWARTLVPVAPGNPTTLIVDEAQDLSLLQWDVVTRWAQHTDHFLCAGDDDQALYRWCGGDFRPLLAAPNRRVLPRSYRVPARVQAYARQFTEAIGERQAKVWEPRPEPGVCQDGLGTWDTPDYVLGALRAWLEEPWGTYACIAPCAYMLEPLVAVLRSAGIPFGNRWRRRQRAWNPLAPPPRGVSTAQRLLDFARPADRLWTWRELATWLPLIRTDGVLTRGAKSQVALHADEDGACPLATLEQLFLPESLAGALAGDLQWLEYQVLQSRAKGLAYPLRVYRTYGRTALVEEPRVIVGTAHSLKGAEADTVVFFKDLSRAQQVQLYHGGAGADDVYRLLYVAATRARETLLILEGHYG